MSKIRIKNFGPIKEGYLDNDGFMDIKKVTMFIGNQGSGKSTVAKLISTFTWLEKALNRGDKSLKMGNDIIQSVAWQRLASYFVDKKSEIEYVGAKFKITYKHGSEKPWPEVDTVNNSHYLVPKIMYVPSERNFLSTLKGAFDFSGLPGPLASFAEEYKRAQIELNGSKLNLPFENFAYEYDEYKDVSYVVGNDYKIDLLDASSGLHSLIPLFLVSRNLSMKIEHEKVPSIASVSANQSVRRDREISNIMMNNSLASEEKNKLAEEVFAKYHNKCFINIVEEPEQNLFPASQRAMLNSLLKFNNTIAGNKLVLTTHSPYIIIYLSLAIQGDELKKKILASPNGQELLERLNKIVSEYSTICNDDVVIYEIKDGKIIQLPNDQGIPSDKNYLYQSLAEGNHLFDSLLEIEQEL